MVFLVERFHFLGFLPAFHELGFKLLHGIKTLDSLHDIPDSLPFLVVGKELKGVPTDTKNQGSRNCFWKNEFVHVVSMSREQKRFVHVLFFFEILTKQILDDRAFRKPAIDVCLTLKSKPIIMTKRPVEEVTLRSANREIHHGHPLECLGFSRIHFRNAIVIFVELDVETVFRICLPFEVLETAQTTFTWLKADRFQVFSHLL